MFLAILLASQLGTTHAHACPTEPGEVANIRAREIVETFRARFGRDVRVPDWCFASTDDHDEIAQRLVAVCSERPGNADAEALALVALKAGRCAGFEAGRRSTQGASQRGAEKWFGMESGDDQIGVSR